MSSLLQPHDAHTVAHAIGVIALVCSAGMALGSLRVGGIGLGTAGVLFSGLVAGHLGEPVDQVTLDFVKELGLILFVFTIGLQLGPGFFSALREAGVRLNALAAGIVLFGAGLAVALGRLLGLDPAGVLGMLAGATTNTPSLGAAQQTLSTLPGVVPEQMALPALAYAVSYPAGIAGIVASLVVVQRLFRIDARAEALAAEQRDRVAPLEHRSLVVDNPNLTGVAIDDIPSRAETGVIVSRHRPAGETEVRVATGGTLLRQGDSILAVGIPEMLDSFQREVGRRSDEDLYRAPGKVAQRRIVVTNKDVLGKTVAELELDAQCGAVVSRVTRADIELTAVPGLRLQFGDMVRVAGDEEALGRTERLLGNSVKELNETHFIAFFLGILGGIVVGTAPIALPGLEHPVRLGLAGGPLLVALVLGRFGRIGRLVCHMPVNANLAFREFGIALFFAAVGLGAGRTFLASVFSTSGIAWLAAGLCVTVLPLLSAAIFARTILKMSFATLSGLLAGSMTDPPALAFATNLSGSDAPTVAYATVYPLTMLLRILTAQLLALMLIR